ncbi:Bifunctional protein GlmU [Candidatus Jidaibacter acanthamoeba]|uniref:Bifunctional protein GlmU n=2 Tax=Candidatus Jidaibacter acanthamoebae TaxID=86105 RepID=A0A0C1QMP8_9RICK|nr:Bifunctional protein GlmU [Candidatus Jidaibacter acanthamoeba]
MKTALPKVMHSVGNMPLIEHIINLSRQISTDIRVVASETLKEHAEFMLLENKYNFASYIQEEQLGTAHALQCAELENIGSEYILVLYGDTPLVTYQTLNQMIERAKNSNATITAFGFYAQNPTGYGRFITDHEQNLLDIIEEKDAAPEVKRIDLCNSGIMLIKTSEAIRLIKEIKNNNASGEYYLTDLIRIANDNAYSCSYILGDEEEALGVNDLAQLARLEEIFQNRMRRKMMSEGVILIAPHTVHFSADTIIVGGSKIYPYVFFGAGVVIEKDTEIFSFSHIEQSKIGANCKIGPFARLRPNNVLSGDNKIGNFVELKNARLAEGAKASHLSYIGDAEVGKNCNIGAGTIFCNYDGKNKHFSKVGNDVFIGSNSAIISPVNIGDNALIGAGSTITQDVEPNDLAIARARQVNLKGRGRKRG